MEPVDRLLRQALPPPALARGSRRSLRLQQHQLQWPLGHLQAKRKEEADPASIRWVLWVATGPADRRLHLAPQRLSRGSHLRLHLQRQQLLQWPMGLQPNIKSEDQAGLASIRWTRRTAVGPADRRLCPPHLLQQTRPQVPPLTQVKQLMQRRLLVQKEIRNRRVLRQCLPMATAGVARHLHPLQTMRRRVRDHH